MQVQFDANLKQMFKKKMKEIYKYAKIKPSINSNQHYDKTLEAKEGRLVIWPAFFTHTHKGVVSKTQTKYIATGWFNYDSHPDTVK